MKTPTVKSSVKPLITVPTSNEAVLTKKKKKKNPTRDEEKEQILNLYSKKPSPKGESKSAIIKKNEAEISKKIAKKPDALKYVYAEGMTGAEKKKFRAEVRRTIESYNKKLEKASKAKDDKTYNLTKKEFENYKKEVYPSR